MLMEGYCCRFESSVVYVGKMFVSSFRKTKVHCYFATRPEVEGFRDQGFVVQMFFTMY